jgi:hypothetical protein
MEHAHPSHAHIVLQLAQWVNFELKSYAQIEHQCICLFPMGVEGPEPTKQKKKKGQNINS